jgi:hypothetical protein
VIVENEDFLDVITGKSFIEYEKSVCRECEKEMSESRMADRCND